MADIRFWCPHCGKKLGVDENGAGLTISCPDCHKSLLIPAATGGRETPSKALRHAGRSAEPVTLRITLPRFRWRIFLSDGVLLAGLFGLFIGIGFLFHEKKWVAALLLIIPLLSALKLFLRRRFLSGTVLFLVAAIALALSLFMLTAPSTPKGEPAIQKEGKSIQTVTVSVADKTEETVHPPTGQPVIPMIEDQSEPPPAQAPVEPRNVPAPPPMDVVTPAVLVPPAPKTVVLPKAGGKVQ